MSSSRLLPPEVVPPHVFLPNVFLPTSSSRVFIAITCRLPDFQAFRLPVFLTSRLCFLASRLSGFQAFWLPDFLAFPTIWLLEASSLPGYPTLTSPIFYSLFLFICCYHHPPRKTRYQKFGLNLKYLVCYNILYSFSLGCSFFFLLSNWLSIISFRICAPTNTSVLIFSLEFLIILSVNLILYRVSYLAVPIFLFEVEK
ncbi:hypothetical protein L9F63_010241, partial [Diploptera punctata]